MKISRNLTPTLSEWTHESKLFLNRFCEKLFLDELRHFFVIIPKFILTLIFEIKFSE